ncbi:unnamed protein product [marine sediment metagenome]|uniref:Radical SAM core domain-containing protein n=1 Tax=marine sediment metagenome TaxID=412755 RepID=X1IBY2_9ZZZZ
MIIGGQGTLWEDLVKYNFKHIIRGEGEVAFNKILEGSVSNKIVEEENTMFIDDLKFPDRGRCDTKVPIFTARGCPWNCYFCSSQKFWRKVRYHSPEYFMAEVDYILETYPLVNFICIFDDLFIANRSRFNEIYDLWMKKGLRVFSILSLPLSAPNLT